MSFEFVPIGKGNFVNQGRIVGIVRYNSKPIQKMVRDLKKSGKIIDATGGERTRSLVITPSYLFLSPLLPEELQEIMEKMSE
ncbi:MAG: DUF370 domain-containing protein [Caldiserica bacterium]|nr:DUF370 domain-containing protein [Caldisericota bacterium]